MRCPDCLILAVVGRIFFPRAEGLAKILAMRLWRKGIYDWLSGGGTQWAGTSELSLTIDDRSQKPLSAGRLILQE